ncbi:uncharacterized protein LOC108485368 isoform X1 [Gossypium arboreum]|uniref:DUF7653 domain-containing protein n=2 Tax=Gossypium arboreum TaxID=29729 RepID=A0ABR0Q926_GOSAR|nr:uncharacterized protein LOC108485368 isoform X1 [Gossypium arboreum]XP_052883082.1 uncharacterized protein LOC108485368 isoform X1 [Gossypium arboreum]XP_052883083.1 uncharacterized protein LOC108485368 isoform X1 [Gossypium arboreum]XP_052883084.1 uncharacterized protein LOC108485368 isoform X1 [Gossypium arboreum]XP_052883085.1 uncharacterized protein LOC108485368 isoform X1 [Gossypium arboreum]KAK5835840.1 hypothetical protein PVK06_011552 [Gossypium arboreum]
MIYIEMKKLFFFKSSSSSSGNNKVLPASTDKQVYQGKTSESWLTDQLVDMADYSWKLMSDSPSFSNASSLVRSHSLSSGNELGQQNCSSSQQQYDHRSRGRAHMPEKKSKAKQCETEIISFERPCSSGSSRLHHYSSGSSSSCSSNVSTQVIDRYIDGEQLLEISKLRNSSTPGNGGRRHPRRARYTAPSSPTHSVKEKNKSHSFRDGDSIRLHFSSRDRVENGFGQESPWMVAKNVIERLSQTHVVPKSSSKGFNHHIPITNEDVYGRYLNMRPESKLEMDEPYKNCFIEGNSDGLNSSEDDSVVELERRSKHAKERALLLSEAHEQESFICNGGFDVSSLLRSVQHLKEEKEKLALEVLDLQQFRIDERVSARKELRMVREEMESQIEKLEKEKHETQLRFEKEFDRRSSDWSVKLEKYRLEEQRLRDRVQELAEQNVSLQREVSSFNDRETENRSLTKYSEQQLKELMGRVEKMNDENQDLIQNLSESQEKHRAAMEDVACVRRNLEEKEKECKELQKSVTRLLRTCTEQEKTIEGLRDGYGKEIEKKQSMEKNEKQVQKLQREQMRLTGVELALRKEVESYRLEAYSLRCENIYLLNQLKGNGNEIIGLTFKFDNELQDHVCRLQNHGLSMLNEIINLSSKLIEFIKGKPSHLQGTQPGLDSQFIVESDPKIEGFKRGIESLRRSLQTISGLLHEKSGLVASDSHSASVDPTMSTKRNNQSSEKIIRSELKAETMMTSLLKEKLYSKEVEIEELQAEVAAALRGNEILRCELQNSTDNISCLTHRLKDLQLQIPKKDENVSRLERELQESTKELTILKGILVKVSEERDLMWEEVKQYNEKNMVLNSEVNALKKRIEGLEEDIHLKEGQITILKDTLSNHKSFDLLGSPTSMPEFLLE